MLLVAPLLEVSLFASKKAANLVNSLRISLSAQPNSSLVAHPFAVTKLSSRAQLSRIMGARDQDPLLARSELILGRAAIRGFGKHRAVGKCHRHKAAAFFSAPERVDDNCGLVAGFQAGGLPALTREIIRTVALDA